MSTHMDRYFFTNVYYNRENKIPKWEENTVDVLKKINKLRIDRGWSLYRLSEEAGLAQSTVINMFNRETRPSLTTLESLCSAFGVTMSEFFEEDKPNEQSDITKEELERMYDALSPTDRKLIAELMKSLARE